MLKSRSYPFHIVYSEIRIRLIEDISLDILLISNQDQFSASEA
jgi:hypothetical protein